MRYGKQATRWGGCGRFLFLLLLLLLARVAAASGPSYPTGLTVRTTTCGANPRTTFTWNTSTPDPATNSPIWFYALERWDGSIFRSPDEGNALFFPSQCVSGVCTFERPEIGVGGPWYYAVVAIDVAGHFSQTPLVCPAPFTGGGGTCSNSGCTPYPCIQCTYNGTSPCTVSFWCTDPGGCADISACLTGTTSTTTTSTTTSTTTTLVSKCASPTVIAAGGGTVNGTTTGGGASTLQGTCGTSTGPEKVYQWTPSLSGVAMIQTCGGTTNFDTVLYMRATTCTTGTEVACNDDGPCACGSTCGGTWASKITPTVSAGTTYFIVVDGRAGASGNFTLTVTPPSATTTVTTATTSSSTTTTTSGGGATTTTTLNIPMVWKWNKTIQPTTSLAYSSVDGVAIDGSGNVGATGKVSGSVNFGDGVVAARGVEDFFIAKYTAAGSLAWKHIYGESTSGSGAEEGFSVAFDPSGNLIATGIFRYSVDFGTGTPLVATGNNVIGDIMLVKFNNDSTGTTAWAKRIGGVNNDQGYAVRTDGSGNIYLTGYFRGSVDFGSPCPTLVSVGGAVVDVNAFVAKYDASGACVWARGLGTPSTPGNQLVVDGSGNVYITGWYRGTADFSPYSTPTSSGGKDIYVAKLNSSNVVQWAKSAGVAGTDDVGTGVALDGSGNVLLTGTAGGVVNFGGPPTAAAGSYLAKLAADGTQTWIKLFPSSPSLAGVAGDTANFITLAGGVTGTLCFGGGGACEFTNNTEDVLIARFNSANTNTWHVRAGGTASSTGSDGGTGIAAIPAGSIAVGGIYTTSNTNFGGGALPTPLAQAGFVVKFDP